MEYEDEDGSMKYWEIIRFVISLLTSMEPLVTWGKPHLPVFRMGSTVWIFILVEQEG